MDNIDKKVRFQNELQRRSQIHEQQFQNQEGAPTNANNVKESNANQDSFDKQLESGKIEVLVSSGEPQRSLKSLKIMQSQQIEEPLNQNTVDHNLKQNQKQDKRKSFVNPAQAVAMQDEIKSPYNKDNTQQKQTISQEADSQHKMQKLAIDGRGRLDEQYQQNKVKEQKQCQDLSSNQRRDLRKTYTELKNQQINYQNKIQNTLLNLQYKRQLEGIHEKEFENLKVLQSKEDSWKRLIFRKTERFILQQDSRQEMEKSLKQNETIQCAMQHLPQAKKHNYKNTDIQLRLVNNAPNKWNDLTNASQKQVDFVYTPTVVRNEDATARRLQQKIQNEISLEQSRFASVINTRESMRGQLRERRYVKDRFLGEQCKYDTLKKQNYHFIPVNPMPEQARAKSTQFLPNNRFSQAISTHTSLFVQPSLFQSQTSQSNKQQQQNQAHSLIQDNKSLTDIVISQQNSQRQKNNNKPIKSQSFYNAYGALFSLRELEEAEKKHQQTLGDEQITQNVKAIVNQMRPNVVQQLTDLGSLHLNINSFNKQAPVQHKGGKNIKINGQLYNRDHLQTQDVSDKKLQQSTFKQQQSQSQQTFNTNINDNDNYNDIENENENDNNNNCNNRQMHNHKFHRIIQSHQSAQAQELYNNRKSIDEQIAYDSQQAEMASAQYEMQKQQELYQMLRYQSEHTEKLAQPKSTFQPNNIMNHMDFRGLFVNEIDFNRVQRPENKMIKAIMTSSSFIHDNLHDIRQKDKVSRVQQNQNYQNNNSLLNEISQIASNNNNNFKCNNFNNIQQEQVSAGINTSKSFAQQNLEREWRSRVSDKHVTEEQRKIQSNILMAELEKFKKLNQATKSESRLYPNYRIQLDIDPNITKHRL